MSTRLFHPTLLTNEQLVQLSRPQEPPCLSLYQPTHRRFPENQQDSIRFRNLVKQLATSLRQLYPAAAVEWLLEPFEALADQRAFWNHSLDGLAVLGRPSFFRIYTLPQSLSELAVVADSFHTKPLRRYLQSTDRFQVLALSLQSVRLLEGNQHMLDEVELIAEVPGTITQALGTELSEPHQTVASYGGVGVGSAPMHHGHGGKKDEQEVDTLRYFRAVDRAILRHYSRPSSLPLIVAALPEHQASFRQLSQNPFLVSEGIRANPESLTAEALRAGAWQIMAARYEARWAELVADFEQSRARGLGSDDLALIAEAAVAGRIATLLIQADREIGGRLDTATGRFQRIDLSHPRVDDLLDDLGELVAATGGQVLVMPAERLATQSGVAATFRY